MRQMIETMFTHVSPVGSHPSTDALPVSGWWMEDRRKCCCHHPKTPIGITLALASIIDNL